MKYKCLFEKDNEFRVNAFLFKQASSAQPVANSLPVSKPCKISHVRPTEIIGLRPGTTHTQKNLIIVNKYVNNVYYNIRYMKFNFLGLHNADNFILLHRNNLLWL